MENAGRALCPALDRQLQYLMMMKMRMLLHEQGRAAHCIFKEGKMCYYRRPDFFLFTLKERLPPTGQRQRLLLYDANGVPPFIICPQGRMNKAEPFHQSVTGTLCDYKRFGHLSLFICIFRRDFIPDSTRLSNFQTSIIPVCTYKLKKV